jgi:uncharacterized protein
MMPMTFRVFTLGLTLSSYLAAEAPPPRPQADGQLRLLLEDRHGELSKAAKGLLGPTGGNQLFYLPTRDEPATPATWGCKFEEVAFKSADGTPLHGWFIPTRNGKPVSTPTIVFSHGNAGSIGHHLGFVVWLAEAGYNVLMYDYRGFGKSGGSVARRGMVDDVKAAFNYTSGRADVNSSKLVSYGHSLGGAKSVTAIGESPVRGLRAIVIDGAFASYQAMARLIGGQLGASLVTDELAPKDFVGKLSPVPLLVVHGARDEVVPVSQGRQLFQSAREPKTLSRDNGEFRKRMLAWLAAKTGD